MAYQLLIDSVKFDTGEEGQTGRASYISGIGTFSALPAVGDAFAFFGTTAASCKLRRIEMEYFEKNLAYVRYNLSYSTPQKGGGGGGTSRELESRQFTFGGDMQTLEKPSGWVWETGSSVVDIPIPSRILTINFTRPTGPLTNGAFESLKGTIIATAGKVNASTFDGWPAQSVLFNGASGGDYRDENGNLKWKLSLDFSVRLVPGHTTGGWQYVLRPDGEWDTPKHGSSYLYAAADFSALFP